MTYSETDPPGIERELERDALIAVHLALADLTEGEPIDVDHLRSLVASCSDQANAHATDPDADPASAAAAASWVDRYRRLSVAVDHLEARDVDAARAAIRSAMYREDTP